MSLLTCPNDNQLLPALLGEPVPKHLLAHVEACPECRSRIQQSSTLLNSLRGAALSGSVISDFITPAPTMSVLLNMAAGKANSREEFHPATDDMEIPVQIGKYRVIRRLNAGAQGTVYHAWHTGLQREVAIKLSHESLSPERQQRMMAEGALLAKVCHPALAKVYDIDFDNGRPFLVMEYVAGHNLRQVMKMTNLPLSKRLAIMRDLAAAVAAAHRSGILHLDLKPENVMLDDQYRVKLIDLGMSWLLPARRPETREVVGTFEYMSPEQMRGQTDRWSCRTDVFGLGAVLYFLLTGHSPVSQRRICTPREHEEELKSAIRKLSDTPGLDQLPCVCAKAMHVDPAERYADAQRFSTALSNASQRHLWVLSLIVIGLLAMVLAILSPAFRRSSLLFSPVAGSTSNNSHVGLYFSATCAANEELKSYLVVANGTPIRLTSTRSTIHNGVRTYQFPGSGGISIAQTEWALIVSVKETPNVSDTTLMQMIESACRYPAPDVGRAEFATTAIGTRQASVTLQADDFISRLTTQLATAKINSTGVYIKLPTRSVDGPVPGVKICTNFL